MWILIVVFFVGVLSAHLLERLFPIMPEYTTGITRRGYLTDAISTMVNGPGVSGLTKIAVVWAVQMVPAGGRFVGAWPWAVQFAVFFLVNDFVRYWLHRWYHASDWLWRMHRVHHTCVEMDALSVFRMHVGESIIKNGILFLPFQVLGINPYVIIVYSSIDILKGFWHHANVRTYIGPLNFLFNSAELHWWHHSTEARGQHSNYGSVLSIWDWLFRTAYWPRGTWPEHIGVDGMEAFPNDYIGQFASIRFDDETAMNTYNAAAETKAAKAASDNGRPAVAPQVSATQAAAQHRPPADLPPAPQPCNPAPLSSPH